MKPAGCCSEYPSVKPTACQLSTRHALRVPFQGSLDTNEPPLKGEAFLPCEFSSTKLPRRGKQAAAAAVTLPFSQLKLGRKVSGDSPLSLLKRKKEAKKEKSSPTLVLMAMRCTKITQRTATQHNPTMYELNNKTPCTFSCREFCFLPAYASEFFCEGTAYKLVSHAGIYSWCRIYKS